MRKEDLFFLVVATVASFLGGMAIAISCVGDTIDWIRKSDFALVMLPWSLDGWYWIVTSVLFSIGLALMFALIVFIMVFKKINKQKRKCGKQRNL